MERRETVSVNITDIEDCVKKKIYEQYPYLEHDDDVYGLELESNFRFLLFKVVRLCDVTKDGEVKN